MEIAGFGTAIILPLSFCTPLFLPSHFQSRGGGGGAEVIACDTLGREERGRIALHQKAECHGSRMRCIACRLITVELFKIEAAAAAEYF